MELLIRCLSTLEEFAKTLCLRLLSLFLQGVGVVDKTVVLFAHIFEKFSLVREFVQLVVAHSLQASDGVWAESGSFHLFEGLLRAVSGALALGYLFVLLFKPGILSVFGELFRGYVEVFLGCVPFGDFEFSRPHKV